jgi:hypothetical protein
VTQQRRSTRSVEFSRTSDGYWEHFWSKEPRPYPIAGKYLFFAKERELLVAVVVEELSTGSFHRAKVLDDGVDPTAVDSVLCLYYSDGNRHDELKAKYRERIGVRYVRWKSDDATARGDYAAGFHLRLAQDAQFGLLGEADSSAGKE